MIVGETMAFHGPVYQVMCAMCQGSFSATADTLPELLSLVKVHLKEMEKTGDVNHRNARFLRTDNEILNSVDFEWGVQEIRPFTNLNLACVQLPPSSSPSKPQRTTDPLAPPA